MRVVVVTGRGFADEKLLAAKLDHWTAGLKTLVVYTRRHCRLVQDWCYRRVPRLTYLVWQPGEPDVDMLEGAGAVVAFLAGPDPAVNALVLAAKKRGLKLRVYDTEEDD